MKEVLDKLESGSALSADETFRVFESFLAEDSQTTSEEDIRAFLLASSRRLPVASELIGAARSLRQHMIEVRCNETNLIDTCGTGGSGLSAFNASTVAAIVCVVAGIKVAKHGNRSITSRCGSADILESLGVQLAHTAASAASAIEETGFAFLFAPLFHPATKRVQLIRKELAVRTIFNFLGPLCNPAGARRQLLGVSDPRMVPVVAEALLVLGTEHAIIACGEDGLDEITLSGKTFVAEVRNKEIRRYEVCPEDFGFEEKPLEAFSGAEPKAAATLVLSMLAGQEDSRSEFVCMNAGAALYVGGVVSSWKEGAVMAKEILGSGRAEGALQKIIGFQS